MYVLLHSGPYYNLPLFFVFRPARRADNTNLSSLSQDLVLRRVRHHKNMDGTTDAENPSRFVVVVVDTITDLTHTSRKMPPCLLFKLLTTQRRG